MRISFAPRRVVQRLTLEPMEGPRRRIAIMVTLTAVTFLVVMARTISGIGRDALPPYFHTFAQYSPLLVGLTFLVTLRNVRRRPRA